jgi:hypothetical protein
MNLTAKFHRVCRSRWLPVVLLVLVGVVVSFMIIHPTLAVTDESLAAQADATATTPAVQGGSLIGGKIAEIVAHILLSLVSNFGKLLMVLINIMVQIAAFNNFTKAAAVQQGWEVARDLCNLLLVLVLLFIAWGTVLRVESYHYRRMLPKFMLMAILINFSKSIAGFLIDISQVIMMSFINVIKLEVYNKLTTGIGLESILEFKVDLPGANFIEVGGALWLALILIALMAGAVLMLIFILLGRIIVLWILVVLSPLAYLGETIGVLKKASTTWWKMFGDYLVVGPLVAFFLWMAMLVIGTSPSSAGQQLAPQGTGSTSLVDAPTSGQNTSSGKFTAAISKISSSDNLLSFIVAVGMLYAAGMAAQQIKTFGGGMGVAAYNKASGAAGWIAKSPKTGADWVNRKQAARTGVDLNPSRVWKNITSGYGEKRKVEEGRMKQAAEERLSKGHIWSPLLGASAPSLVGQYTQGFLYNKGIRKAFGPDIANALGINQKKLGKKTDELSMLREQESHLSGRLKQWKPDDKEVRDRSFDIFTRSGGKVSKEDADKQALAELQNEEIAKNPQLQAVTQQRERVQKEVEGLTAGLERISKWKPTDYYADQKRRAAIDEASKKVGTSDGGRQQVLLEKEIADGNAMEAMGVIKKAFETKNQDTIVQNTTSSKDYYRRKDGRLIDESEYGKMNMEQRSALLESQEPVFKKGTKLTATAEGMQAFMKEVVVGKLKMSQRTADSFGSEMQDIAQSNDQTHLAGSVGMRPDGEYFWRSRNEQQTKVAEFRDKNIRSNYTKGNDKGMFDGERLNAVAIREVVKEFKRLALLLKNGQFNGKLAGKMATDVNIKMLNDVKNTSLVHDDDKVAYQDFIDKLGKYQTGETSISDKLSQIQKELPPPPQP